MCIFSKPKTPSYTPPPSPPPLPPPPSPTALEPSGTDTGELQRRKDRLRYGLSSTIKAGGLFGEGSQLGSSSKLG